MKRKILFICCFLIFQNLFCQSYLESLWEQSEINSKELKLAKLEYENAFLDYQARYAVFIPSFFISTNYDFLKLDSPIDLNKYPLKYYFNFGLEWEIPGGTTISSSLTYEMDRHILNSLEELSVDNSGYNQNPVLSVNINQSLLPFYFQGKAKNPAIQSYVNQLRSANNSYLSTVAGVKISVVELFIQLRKLLRNEQMLTNQIKLQSIICESAFVKLEQGSLTQVDYWNYESSLIEYENNLFENKMQLEQIKKELELICGEIDYSLINNELPESNIKLLSKDMTLESLQIQMDELDNNLILTRQNYAPSLILGGSYSYDLEAQKVQELKQAWSKNGEKKWTVTIGLQISPKNITQINTSKAIYKNNVNNLEEQKNIYLINKTEQIQNYKKIILYYEQVQNQKEQNVKKQKTYLEAIQDKYKRGLCSDLDLLQAQLIFENTVSDLENIKDALWYNRFQLSQMEDVK